MFQKSYRKRFISVILVLVNVFLALNVHYVHAGTLGGLGLGESKFEVFDSEGNLSRTITMKNGIIFIDAQSKAASSGTRWQTIGLSITREPIEKEVTVKNKTGPDSVSTAGSVAKIYFQEEEKKSRGDGNTYIELSAERVQNALMDKFEDITADTPIYLHMIFSTYTVDKNGKRTPGEENCINWKDIMNAETWGNKTLNDFEKFYNMPIIFKPNFHKSYIHYYSEDGQPIKEYDLLGETCAGNYITWDNQPKGINKNGFSYEICGYIVTKTGDGFSKDKAYKKAYIDTGTPISEIIKGQAMMKYGGSHVWLIYKKKTEGTIKVYAVDKDRDEIIDISYEGKINAGKDFTQPLDTINKTITVMDRVYQRTTEAKYTYENIYGSKKNIKLDLAYDYSPVKFNVPLDLMLYSTLEVKIYYKAKSEKPIPVTVKAIDVDTGQVLDYNLGSGSALGDETYTHGKAIPDNLTIGDEYYAYKGNWDWSYTLNTSSKPTELKKGTGNDIVFKAPKAEKVSGGITVKVYYKKDNTKLEEITLRVIMVNKTGNIIHEISREAVTRNQSILKTAINSKSINGIIYTYQNKWELEYSETSGLKSKSGTQATASFLIPPSTSLGTVATLRFYYDGAIPVLPDTPDAPIIAALDYPSPYGVINGDGYSSPYFISQQGIATTESQHVYVKTKDYLLGYTLVNRTGVKDYYVPVTMHYTLEYNAATPKEVDEAKKVREEVSDTQVIKVERTYNYWEIVKLEYYRVSSAQVNNYSLPGGGVSLSANQGYLNLPSLSTWSSSNLEDHVKEPKEVTEGIEVWNDKPITSDTGYRPEVEYIDLTSYANELTGEAQVRNDYLSFDGSVILSNTYDEKKGVSPNPSSLRQCSTITQDKALYTDGKLIQAEKENGTYASNGSVLYSLHPSSINASTNQRTYSVSVNNVILHTPVICDPVITADNDKWIQLINPEEGALQLVLDTNSSLNDFTVKISNTLSHSNRLGYYNRDFSRSFIDPENTSYLAKKSDIVRNEMKLPFDVYIDTLSDNDQSNDSFIKAGTWIVLGRATSRFYLPLWVEEGTYTAEFRTIAVNGTDKLSRTETTRNASISNYVAIAARKIQVSGRIYGLKLYDISDYPNWEEVFRKKNTMLFKYFEGNTDGTKQASYKSSYAYYYSVGTNNQYGVSIGRYSKYTLPLINGSHPNYSNLGVLKTGYAVRFMLDTVGQMYSNACQIKIKPTFFYVDAKGKNRQQVDLYYKEEINGKLHPLVKVGEGIDLVNLHEGVTGNVYSRIPEAELKNTAAVMNTSYAKIANQYSTMYSYSQIRLLKAFRTYIGTDYASYISKHSSFAEVKNATGLTTTSLSKYMQRWYGTYKIPTDVHAAPAGIDVFGYLKKHGIDYKEDFWLKDGYLIVNFNIVTIDDKGKEHLSYINGSNYLNKGNCSMWVMEGAPLEKTDNKGNVFKLKAGDFIMYYIDKKATDDYTGSLYH